MNGENRLNETEGTYVNIGEGLLSIGSIIDTGDPAGPQLVVNLETKNVDDLFSDEEVSSFRRFIRAGWLEEDE